MRDPATSSRHLAGGSCGAARATTPRALLLDGRPMGTQF
jgi:hypothetical protein